MNVNMNLTPVPQNLDALTRGDSNYQSEDEKRNMKSYKKHSTKSESDSIMTYKSDSYYIHHYHLRFYLQQHENDPEMQQNSKWFLTYLDDLLHNVIETQEQELHALDLR